MAVHLARCSIGSLATSVNSAPVIPVLFSTMERRDDPSRAPSKPSLGRRTSVKRQARLRTDCSRVPMPGCAFVRAPAPVAIPLAARVSQQLQ
jgi:hypothetical protein